MCGALIYRAVATSRKTVNRAGGRITTTAISIPGSVRQFDAMASSIRKAVPAR
jgi:hypothetical protein